MFPRMAFQCHGASFGYLAGILTIRSPWKAPMKIELPTWSASETPEISGSLPSESKTVFDAIFPGSISAIPNAWMQGVLLLAGQFPRAPFTPAASMVFLLVQEILSGMKSSLILPVSLPALRSYLWTSLAVQALKYMVRPSELTSTPLGYPARVPGSSASPLPGIHRETYP